MECLLDYFNGTDELIIFYKEGITLEDRVLIIKTAPQAWSDLVCTENHQVPKSGGGRNSTFIIRVMAPCNMRCTTCGEYIYKVFLHLLFFFQSSKLSFREENSMPEKRTWMTWTILVSGYTGDKMSFILVGWKYLILPGSTSNARLVYQRSASGQILKVATMFLRLEQPGSVFFNGWS